MPTDWRVPGTWAAHLIAVLEGGERKVVPLRSA
jgi:hypothetical protein